MILLWGAARDPAIELTAHHLRAMGAPHLLLDPAEAEDVQAELATSDRVTGYVRTRDRFLALEDVRSCYLRGAPTKSARAAALEDLIVRWANVADARVLNRPSASASNDIKPLQLLMAQEAGFRVPPTLLTTSPACVRSFQATQGNVIYKSISGVRSVVRQLEANRDVQGVASCPTQFQRRVRGVDHRVHVVGQRVFATRVDCGADDYRYPGTEERVMRPVTLEPSCKARCLGLARLLDLELTGIDLRQDETGDWYCFEANPSPAFASFPDAESVGIAIAELLCAPRSC